MDWNCQRSVLFHLRTVEMFQLCNVRIWRKACNISVQMSGIVTIICNLFQLIAIINFKNLQLKIFDFFTKQFLQLIAINFGYP